MEFNIRKIENFSLLLANGVKLNFVWFHPALSNLPVTLIDKHQTMNVNFILKLLIL